MCMYIRNKQVLHMTYKHMTRIVLDLPPKSFRSWLYRMPRCWQRIMLASNMQPTEHSVYFCDREMP